MYGNRLLEMIVADKPSPILHRLFPRMFQHLVFQASPRPILFRLFGTAKLFWHFQDKKRSGRGFADQHYSGLCPAVITLTTIMLRAFADRALSSRAFADTCPSYVRAAG